MFLYGGMRATLTARAAANTLLQRLGLAVRGASPYLPNLTSTNGTNANGELADGPELQHPLQFRPPPTHLGQLTRMAHFQPEVSPSGQPASPARFQWNLLSGPPPLGRPAPMLELQRSTPAVSLPVGYPSPSERFPVLPNLHEVFEPPTPRRLVSMPDFHQTLPAGSTSPTSLSLVPHHQRTISSGSPSQEFLPHLAANNTPEQPSPITPSELKPVPMARRQQALPPPPPPELISSAKENLRLLAENPRDSVLTALALVALSSAFYYFY